jgi:hypothetical protein
MQDTQTSAPTLKRNASLVLLALLLAVPGAYGGVSLTTVVSFLWQRPHSSRSLQSQQRTKVFRTPLINPTRPNRALTAR